MSQGDSIIHLVAGGVAGTVGAIVTCPLEVVKTRQQSSIIAAHLDVPPIAQEQPARTQTTCRTVSKRTFGTSTRQRPSNRIEFVSLVMSSSSSADCSPQSAKPTASISMIQCVRHIVRHEGPLALFKGLGPNLIGVAPSRAVYFATYSQAKLFWNNLLPPDSPIVHVFSASLAGFMASTLTNPIWFVKTRLQLDMKKDGTLTAIDCIRQIYAKSGLFGFYKGISASYMGISETIVHFVIYEALKSRLCSTNQDGTNNGSSTAISNNSSINSQQQPGSATASRTSRDFLEFMLAGAISKTVASCVAYPHEVARTRLREEGTKYTAFWQTLTLVAREEGIQGVYRGLTTQLVRQIPNTAIMMATYEAVVYILTSRLEGHQNE